MADHGKVMKGRDEFGGVGNSSVSITSGLASGLNILVNEGFEDHQLRFLIDFCDLYKQKQDLLGNFVYRNHYSINCIPLVLISVAAHVILITLGSLGRR